MSRLFVFWFPLAGTWLMMSLEGPFLAAIIARLADPKPNLAAFGIAFAVAILVEAPVIMMLSASTALVEDAVSFCKLRRFTSILNTIITAVMVLLLFTPLWDSIARELIGLPENVATLSHRALLALLPWPAAIGYRRFYQGLLIRQGLTRWVAYGTVVRLVAMSLTALGLYLKTDLPGVLVGACALSAGVLLEAVASRLMTLGVVRELLDTTHAATRPSLTYPAIITFYWPLAMTSLIGLTLHPIISFFMGHAQSPLESLAVLPVVGSFSFIFRAVGLSYQEVAIAQLARDEQALPSLSRFAVLLGVGASAALAVITFTPLIVFIFHDLSGLSAELTAFSIVPIRIHALLPALGVLLAMQRAILVHGRRTAWITWSTVIELTGAIVVLFLSISYTSLIGATAAAWALVVGRVVGNSSLIAPCLKVIRRINCGIMQRQ
jgi:hypothetical protein